MKKALTIFLTAILMIALTQSSFAQERYVDEVFTDVTITADVNYGLNFSIFPVFLGGDTMALPLKMDVYEPTSDTETERPLIIFGITGTFFPAIVNGGFTGERSDSAVVNFATRMAKRGYVVAVVQYRRGWNARGSALVQQKTILHAAYRGIQDMRNAIRFFRASVEGMSDADLDGMPDGVMNPYGVDTSKIAVGGTGTGGYMSYGATYLKRYEQTLEQKYIDFTDQSNPVPFLDTALFADPYGIDSAAINRPNYPSYSSEFNMGFAFGGALGSRQWVEANDPPFVALHCERDPGAPYNVGDVIAIDPNTQPPSPFAVIPDGAGAFAVLARADSFGNQDVFKNIDWGDTLFTIANVKNGGIPGLYPFDTPFTPGDAMCEGTGVAGDTLQEWGGPWNYFNETVAEISWNTFYAAQIAAGTQETEGAEAVCINTRGNPNDAAIAGLYMDTIVNYLVPHLAIALELGTSVGINEIIVDENVEVYPNPAKSFIKVQYRDGIKMLEGVKVLDMAGRTVRNYTDINATNLNIQREDLTPGLYIIQVSLADGVVNKKILFE